MSSVQTGLNFLDHLLDALVRHSRMDVELTCKGDLHVDDHHTVEDCAIALGEALDQALGDRAGITRFGHAYAPLDEALARAVVDLSGRPWAEVDLGLRRERLGTVSCENLPHILRSLATSSRMALHLDTRQRPLVLEDPYGGEIQLAVTDDEFRAWSRDEFGNPRSEFVWNRL